MSYSNELPLKLLSKCVNCDLNFTNEIEQFKTIKFNVPFQHDILLISEADKKKNMFQNHPNGKTIDEEIKIEIIDALSYMYGVSYQHLLLSYLKTNWKSLLPKSGHGSTTTSVAVDDSNVAVAMCSKCANLFVRLYKISRDFDNASSTHSTLKGAIKSVRDEHQITSNEKLDSKDPKLFQVKLEVTDRDDEMEADCDMDTDSFSAPDSQDENSKTSLVFQEAEIKNEDDDSLKGSYADYTKSANVSTSTGEVFVKRSRKSIHHVLPDLDSENPIKNQLEVTDTENKMEDKYNEQTFNASEQPNQDSSSLFNLDLEASDLQVEGDPLQGFDIDYMPSSDFTLNTLNTTVSISENVCGNAKENNEEILDGKEESGYTCEFCATVICFMYEFRSHMARHKQDKNSETGKTVFPYMCCNLSLPDSETVTNHRKEKHNMSFLKVRCKFCNIFLSGTSLKQHLKAEHNCNPVEKIETFECPKCCLAFETLQSLTIHQKYSGHQVELICGIDNCKKAFKSEALIRKHRRESHGIGELRYACKICGKSFRKQNARQSHLDRHELEHPITCDECGKTFKTKYSYRNHRLKHKDAKLGRENFKCGDCEKRFVDNRGLKKHIRMFHREDTKKIFTCEQCGKTTNNMTNMRIHQRIHDPNRNVKKKGKSPKNLSAT